MAALHYDVISIDHSSNHISKVGSSSNKIPPTMATDMLLCQFAKMALGLITIDKAFSIL